MIKELQQVNTKILSEFRVFKNTESIADVDTSTIRSYDNKKEGSEKGFNKLRPGKNCFQALSYFVNGFCVRSSIIGGKQVPIKAMVLQEHLLEVREFCGILKWVRMDSGFMSEELLRYLDSFVCEAGKNNKIKFIANVKKNCTGAKEALGNLRWKEWETISRGILIQDHRDVQIYQKYDKKHRIIVVKEYARAKDKWQYYTLITNENEMSAHSLLKFYHKRQCIENFFDEAKNSYFIENLPSHKLLGNSVYFNIICLTFNLLRIFRYDSLRKQDQNIQLKTLQKKYFDLEMEHNGKILSIPRWIPIYRSILAVVNRLIKLGIDVNYKIC